MKYDALVSLLLTEMPHTSFNHNGKIVSIDLEIEKFQNNYDGFVQHIKDVFSKISDETAKNKLMEELKLNRHLNLYLNKLFQTDFKSFIQNVMS